MNYGGCLAIFAGIGTSKASGRVDAFLARLCSRGRKRTAGCPDERSQGEMSAVPGVAPVARGCQNTTISPDSSQFHVIDSWCGEHAERPFVIGICRVF